MGRRQQLLEEASAKLREAVEDAEGRDRTYLLEQVVDLHHQALAETDDEAAEAALAG
jgi:hypothetical protein